MWFPAFGHPQVGRPWKWWTPRPQSATTAPEKNELGPPSHGVTGWVLPSGGDFTSVLGTANGLVDVTQWVSLLRIPHWISSGRWEKRPTTLWHCPNLSYSIWVWFFIVLEISLNPLIIISPRKWQIYGYTGIPHFPTHPCLHSGGEYPSFSSWWQPLEACDTWLSNSVTQQKNEQNNGKSHAWSHALRMNMTKNMGQYTGVSRHPKKHAEKIVTSNAKIG